MVNTCFQTRKAKESLHSILELLLKALFGNVYNTYIHICIYMFLYFIYIQVREICSGFSRIT